MLPILLACLIWIPATIGLGWFLLRLHYAKNNVRPLWRLALCGFYGLFLLSMLGTLASFFIGTYPYFPILAAAIGWVAFVVQWRFFFNDVENVHILSALVLVVLIVPAAARGRLGYDIGLYHLQAIKWITSGPTPLGLANLYGRLGFNDGWAPAAAMLEIPLMAGKSVFVLNVLLMLIFGFALIDAALNLFRHGYNRADALLICAIYPWMVYGIKADSLTYDPDFAIILLICFVCSMWLAIDEDFSHTTQAAALSVFAITIKLSAAPLLAGSLAIWLWRAKGRRGLVTRQAVLLSSIGIVAVSLWMARGILLSGCPLYPSTIGRVGQLEWAVPASRVHYEAESVSSWPKYHLPPEQIPAGATWVGRRLLKMLGTQPIVVALGLFGGGIVLLLAGLVDQRAVTRTYRKQAPSWAPPLLVMLIGIGFWFAMAPDVRFGYGYVFCAVAGVFCIGLEAMPIPISPRWRGATMALTVLTLLAMCDYYRKLSHVPVVPWPAIPTAALRTEKTLDGLTVYLPTPPDDRVWNAPLPATLYPEPGLRCELDSAGRPRRFWIERDHVRMRDSLGGPLAPSPGTPGESRGGGGFETDSEPPP